MVTTQPTKKGNRYRNSSPRRRGVFGFGACFGLCSSWKKQRKNLYQDPIPSAAAAHDRGDAVESARHGSKKPELSEFDVVPTSIKEIQMVAAEAKAPPPLVHQVNGKIDPEVIITEEKMDKNQQEQSIPAAVQETSSNRPAMAVKPRQSVSLPAEPRRLRKGKTAASATVEGDQTTAAAGRVDSTVGASMIALTLVVMLIWGKACAILCSAAWVFFLHCFKQSKESSFEHKNVVSSDHRILDLDSHEYKKRVVLKGFLERI